MINNTNLFPKKSFSSLPMGAWGDINKVQPALGCAQHLKAGRNTQHTTTYLTQTP